VKIVSENAFRILGLPVTASDQDIARREEELEAYVAIGQFPTFDTDFPWIGDLDRSQESIEQAIQALNNPSLKLKHSLFWFWEDTSFDRLAMQLLREGKLKEAYSIWDEAAVKFSLSYFKEGKLKEAYSIWDEAAMKSGISYGNVSRLKNLAVLSYAESFLHPTFDDRKFIMSVELWGRVLSSEKFPSKLMALLPGLNDERDIDRLAEVVGNELYSSVRGLLPQWAKDNDWERTVKCLAAFSNGGFSQEFQRRITNIHTTPILEGVEKLCNAINTKQFPNMNDLLESVEQFRDIVSPELDKLKRLLPVGDPALEHYFDKVGQSIRNNAIDYGNNTEDWIKTKELCEFANDIAIGPVLKEMLGRDLTIVSQNVDHERIYGKLLPIDHAPGLGTFNTIGTMLYGSSNFDINTSSYETTLYFGVLFIPLFPLSRYRVIKEGDRYRFLGKLAFRQTEKWHLGLFLFSVALLLIFLISTGGGSNKYENHSEITQPYSSTPSIFPPNNPPSDETNPRTDETKREISSLASEIETSREYLRIYESDMQRSNSLLVSYDTRLKNLKNQLEDAESKSQRGQYFDESVYQSNLDAYNSLVVKYNTESDKGRQLYDRYEKLLSATNEKIDRYNRLIGAK
jgi:hypothetical protein